MTARNDHRAEVRKDLHDVLEIQHIAQGRGQKREDYEPVIIDAILALLDSERQRLVREIREQGNKEAELFPDRGIGSINPAYAIRVSKFNALLDTVEQGSDLLTEGDKPPRSDAEAHIDE